jgi:hypothetical protein
MDLRDLGRHFREAYSELESADYSEPLLESGKQFGKEVSGNFDRNEDFNGQPWKPHAPLTIKLHGEHPLLRLTYAMFNAAIDLQNSAAKYTLENNVITIGIDANQIPYANAQNEGFERIPQREFFYLNEDGQKAVGKVLEDSCFKIVTGVLG